MEQNNTKKLLGFIVPQVVAFALIGINKLIINHDNSPGAGVLVFSEFVIIPMLMGIISAWFWRGLELKGITLTWYSCINSILGIALSSVFLMEGIICLVIVSPLIFTFVTGGAFLGKAIFKRNDNNLNVSVLALLLVVFIVDSRSKHDYENEVSDSIIINASPARVWKNVVAFEPIKEEPTFWLFRIGLPRPMATTVAGYYEGAGRKCIFSNGYVFGERIATYESGKNLTFDIIDQPRDPEIMNHLDLIKGQFLLKDNGDGTTTVTGNSWYKLYVFPTWYYDTWAQSIVRNVHIRVMEHIKHLSEKNQ